MTLIKVHGLERQGEPARQGSFCSKVRLGLIYCTDTHRHTQQTDFSTWTTKVANNNNNNNNANNDDDNNISVTDLSVKIFPVVLCHKTKRAEQCRAKVVVIGVSIVRISATFSAFVGLRAAGHLHTINL